ncbi:MAG: excinuclease ABC subunit UvrA [Planctomycetes bacterium]|nr:excinuclease ABC subunit UvrA [Planctomycetota bacterium]
MGLNEIVVRGAREHNLKNVSVTIPRGSLTTVTGVSGSGKSSLAFDTIHNEGQRRFLESLSSYARQFLGQIEKPAVDQIEGLSPTVSIDQKTVNRNPRSTVGTVTEILDHLRLLFARLGTPYCPDTGEEIRAQTADQIRDRLLAERAGRSLIVLAPIVKDRKGEYRKELEDLRLQGFLRVRIDGELRRLDEDIALARYKRHSIEVVIDRITAGPDKASRLAEALESGLKLGDGIVGILDEDRHDLYSSRMASIATGRTFPDLEPRLFSFNSPHGACPTCDGLGILRDADESLIVPDPGLSIREGALAPLGNSKLRDYGQVSWLTLPSIARHYDFSLDLPWGELPERIRRIILHGSAGEEIKLESRYQGKNWQVKSSKTKAVEGLVPGLRAAFARNPAQYMERYLSDVACRDCGGSRLNEFARAVRFRGRSIAELTGLCVADLRAFVATIDFDEREEKIGHEIRKELLARLEFLDAVGLGYLEIDRSAATLSGGESQRIRLATQVGSRLKGILYVLDEPSIGLHARDNARLIRTLEELRDLGNTVLVVEHDQEMMERSDHIIDIGPAAGVHGGEILSAGSYRDLIAREGSATGDYLSGRRGIPLPRERRRAGADRLRILGAAHNNLKDLDVSFPVGLFNVVTGVSGSGKSTLIDDILKRALARHYHGALDRPGRHRAVEGLEFFDKVIEIDQSPIGRTPRSNPATYTKVFDLIRDLFAQIPEAKARGWSKGRFSFNVAGGRCEGCSGAGVKTVSMQFLPDVEVICDDCAGKRFNDETLELRYRGKDIHDVLEMTVEEAAAFFANHAKIKRILDALVGVGLDYLRLGQTATTLSGGEAQRVKLASELRRPATGRTLYLLDEPTTGLHFQDIEKLLEALQGLVAAGNTVVVVEHNLDVIKVADWVVDLGPEGGRGGGQLVYEGPFDGILDQEGSHTGVALRAFLGRRKLDRRKRKAPVDNSVTGALVVEGARTHNLKNVDVTIPTGSFTVVTGPSGSGKTSLAFDTIFAEGQRRFVESLSAYARQFLGRLEKAPVDRIEGLAPAIAINQKNVSRNPRSTVATTTEIYDYLRLLWARIGLPHCPDCGRELEAESPGGCWKRLFKVAEGQKGRLVAPLHDPELGLKPRLARPADLAGMVADLRAEGWLRVLVDGQEKRLDEDLGDLGAARRLHLVIDRIQVKAESRKRVLEALPQAFRIGEGLAAFLPVEGEEVWFTAERICVSHGRTVPESFSPRMFSFNSHHGSCPTCSGLGKVRRCDPDLLVDRPEKPIMKGAMSSKVGRFFQRKSYYRKMLAGLGELKGFDPDRPWNELDSAARELILDGCDERVPLRMRRTRKGESTRFEMNVTWPGLRNYVERWYGETESESWRETVSQVMNSGDCKDCGGARLRRDSLAVTVAGKNLAEATALTVGAAHEFFAGVRLKAAEKKIAERPLKEIRDRLRFLAEVGLDYLGLDRRATTLSGGEAQRIRLATQIGSRLTGVLYVLDEPTIGLHQRDVDRLLGTLEELRSLGNTVVVVEHDEDTIERADHLVDIGPGAGHRGGQIVYQGPRAQILDQQGSLTADYLSGRRRLPLPEARRTGNGKLLSLRKVRTNNLRGVDFDLPLGTFTCVTGVSGSGKSSLVVETLVPAVIRTLRRGSAEGAIYDKLVGARHVSDLVVIDQTPIGRSPKSNPATYTGCFDHVRQVFATAPMARMKGFKPGRFSFNAPGGRCEACSGRGSVKIDMSFLADVWITCEVCRGRRFNSETLLVQYRGKTVADVLEMEVDEALEFFANHRRIAAALQTLADVGLGYLRLGQPANTLSGGEAQRIKLAAELSRRGGEAVLYVLDEPTTGLHFDDVTKLAGVLHRLVAAGHTVCVIEHNLDVILSADHVVDLGPDGGADGGRIVAAGSPEEIMAVADSATGRFLARHAEKRAAGPRAVTKGRRRKSRAAGKEGVEDGAA